MPRPKSLSKPQDPGWEHGTRVHGSRLHIECRHCGRQIHGGITRFKQHLASQRGETLPCTRCPAEVKRKMALHLRQGKVERETKSRTNEYIKNELEIERDYYYEPEDEDEITHMKNLMEDVAKQRFDRDMRAREVMGGAGSSRGGPELRRSQSTTENIGNLFRFGRGKSTKHPRSSTHEEGLPFSTSSMRYPQSKQRKLTQMLGDGKEKVATMWKRIGRWFYHNHIPAHAADSMFFKPMLESVADAGLGASYPVGKDIGGHVLDDEVELIDRQIEIMRPNWEKWGCSIMCDGWTTDNQKHTLINFLVYNKCGVRYLKSFDATGAKKTGEYILKMMEWAINFVGEKNVVQIVTDNGANFKKAGKLLEKKIGSIFWAPCVAHSVDLIIEDICKEVPLIDEVVNAGKLTTRFIYRYPTLATMMRQFTGCEILRPGLTRFATHFIALDSLMKLRVQLRQFITSTQWEVFKTEQTISTREQASKVENILLDEGFWEYASIALGILEPLVRVLKLADEDDPPAMGFIYDAFERAYENIVSHTSEHVDVVVITEILEKRWWFQCQHRLHHVAHLLNPHFRYREDYDDPVHIMEKFKQVVQIMEKDINHQIAALNELETYTTRTGSFGTQLALAAIYRQHPGDWWSNFGESAPTLQRIAIRLLSQNCSIGACERNWSTFDLIHTKRRNRLSTAKLDKLVYVHYNLRMHARDVKRRNRKAEAQDELGHAPPLDLDYIWNTNEYLMEPWLVELDPPVLDDPNANNDWINEADDDDAPQESKQPNVFRTSQPQQSPRSSTQVKCDKGKMPQGLTRKKKKVVLSSATTTNGSSSNSDTDGGNAEINKRESSSTSRGICSDVQPEIGTVIPETEYQPYGHHQPTSFGHNAQHYHHYVNAEDYGMGNLSLSDEYSSQYSNSHQGYQGYEYFFSNYESLRDIQSSMSQDVESSEENFLQPRNSFWY